MALESKNGPKPLPHMGQECSGWKGSQSEHNCVTDTKKSAKTGQNWPKIAQTMAIFHHKWLILWRKKIIFINIQLPMGSGQHLIPIGYLEVPLPAACSLVWRALWNRPAPFWLVRFPDTGWVGEPDYFLTHQEVCLSTGPRCLCLSRLCATDILQFSRFLYRSQLKRTLSLSSHWYTELN